jgi:predicted NBD/HSP70 family sugar kinase
LPSNIPADEFMDGVRDALKEESLFPPDADLIGYSICGPVVVERTEEGKKYWCLRLINRGILEPFVVEADAALNDGMAAAIGSSLAGVAKTHEGAFALLTFGAGVGLGSMHWNEQGERVVNDGEIHFPIRGSTQMCACKREGCFEAAANVSALRRYALSEGLTEEEITEDLGRRFEQYLVDGEPADIVEKLTKAMDRWHRCLAEGIANLYVSLDMGGNTIQPPAMFIMGGGLGALVDEEKLVQYVLDTYQGDPVVGTNVVVRREDEVGNRAGSIGAAALALANHIGCHVTEIKFSETAPK